MVNRREILLIMEFVLDGILMTPRDVSTVYVQSEVESGLLLAAFRDPQVEVHGLRRTGIHRLAWLLIT